MDSISSAWSLRYERLEPDNARALSSSKSFLTLQIIVVVSQCSQVNTAYVIQLPAYTRYELSFDEKRARTEI